MTGKRCWLLIVFPIVVGCYLVGGAIYGMCEAARILSAEFNREWDTEGWEEREVGR